MAEQREDNSQDLGDEEEIANLKAELKRKK
jgi:hypothetical protein